MKRIISAAMFGLAMSPLIALAHAHLQQSAPANGSNVSVAPGNLALTFSESAHLTALNIQKEGAAQAHKLEPLPKAASQHFAIALPQLGAGVYTITYRVVSADDNHISSGAIKFTIASGPADHAG